MIIIVTLLVLAIIWIVIELIDAPVMPNDDEDEDDD